MGEGIYAALSGAIAQSSALEATATNMANSGTDGYRSIRPVFREVMSQQAIKGQPLRFSALSGMAIDQSSGAIRETGRSMDVVLPEKAFLVVQTPGGERYTKAGALTVGADGILRSPGGHPVLPEKRDAKDPIKLDPTGIHEMLKDGRVATAGEAGARLRIVTFENPQHLAPEGAHLFAATQDSGAINANTEPLSVGSLEGSNAEPMSAMHNLITSTRLFEAFERIISTFHESDRKVISSVPATR